VNKLHPYPRVSERFESILARENNLITRYT
jgi:hypothetical protein